MSCKRCPHYVKHGFVNGSGDLEFKNLCGLKVREQHPPGNDKFAGKKASQALAGKKAATQKMQALWNNKLRTYSEDETCDHFPFTGVFEHTDCQTYQAKFKIAGKKNDVIPTKDFEYSDRLQSTALSDFELF